MTELLVSGQAIRTVFDLLGSKENDMTFALGWCLHRAPTFLSRISSLIGQDVLADEPVIRLQEYQPGSGITDIEIEKPGSALAIIEAKSGWTLPSEQQISQYAGRVLERKLAPCRGLIVALTCYRDEVARSLAKVGETIGEVPVRFLSWQSVIRAAEETKAEASYAERRLLGELVEYLRGIISVQRQESNWVYVVSLSSETVRNGDISFIDVVEKHGKYYHPIGNGWPSEPPNYIGFRYHGCLQSIHHVEDHDVLTNFSDHFPNFDDEEVEPLFIYQLGPAIRPNKEVRSGKISNFRRWAMIDTLLTCDTVLEASRVSRARNNPDL